MVAPHPVSGEPGERSAGCVVVILELPGGPVVSVGWSAAAYATIVAAYRAAGYVVDRAGRIVDGRGVHVGTLTIR
jgi:hypothetical protein